jgi:hypothetical protein
MHSGGHCNLSGTRTSYPARPLPRHDTIVPRAHRDRCRPLAIALTAGFGASIFKMMDVSRHKSVDTLRGYERDADGFRDHAGKGLL